MPNSASLIAAEEERVPPQLPGLENASAKRLLSYIERIERITGEVDGLQADIKDVKTEAKSFGFDVKTINHIVKLRKLDPEKRREAEELIELYKAAINMD